MRARASIASGSSSSISEISLPAARLSPSRSDATRERTESRDREAGALWTDTPSSPFARPFEESDDVAERRPGAKDHPNPGLLELRDVFFGDDAPARDDDVARLSFLEQLHDGGEESHVCAAQTRQADRVDVFLDRGFDD